MSQESDPLTIRAVALGQDLHLLSGPGGNVIVLCADPGLLLVDSEYRQVAPNLRESVAAVSTLPVRWIVNTHWHFDHVGGNAGFVRTGARIAAHENVRRRMEAGQKITGIDVEIPPDERDALPEVTFSDTVRIHLGGKEVLLIHPGPAHTDGDAVVFFPDANLIHAGDIYFNCGYPFIDLSSGGSIDGVIDAVDLILGIGDEETQIVPGHGPLATKADLRSYRTMLAGFREIIAREIANGNCLEAVLKDRPTAELDARYGEVFFSPAQFTEIVFRSLTEAE